ncbi:hypothetical protein PRUPE_5G068900 [Prunus persica]|uniref:Uncharacterized protein n=1 Tax=Prunus persica TaxID=3760 RepID=A0A251P4R9_PRUPE|nr:hypothetical protein PRUPE_5G068900 [Prunus persica]
MVAIADVIATHLLLICGTKHMARNWFSLFRLWFTFVSLDNVSGLFNCTHSYGTHGYIFFYTCIANFIHGCILISTYVINHNQSTFFKGFRERGASEFRTS